MLFKPAQMDALHSEKKYSVPSVKSAGGLIAKDHALHMIMKKYVVIPPFHGLQYGIYPSVTELVHY
jgi:hypothetical protein